MGGFFPRAGEAFFADLCPAITIGSETHQKPRYSEGCGARFCGEEEVAGLGWADGRVGSSEALSSGEGV